MNADVCSTVNELSAVFKQVMICFDVSDYKKLGSLKRQFVIGFKYLGETLVCELEIQEIT